MKINAKLALEFKIKESQVNSTVALIDEGNTIPFIARYRKEVTGGLSDVLLRDLHERLFYLRSLEDKKAEVLRMIDEQGKLTEELKAKIEKAEVLQRVEDLYKPFKQKKQTRAGKAKAKGLEPFALEILAQNIYTGTIKELAKKYINSELGVETEEDAIAGAKDIIAEIISDDPEITKILREKTYNAGVIKSEATDIEVKSVYEMYYDKSEGIRSIPNHRVLAMNRGENEKFLKVKIVTIPEEMEAEISKQIITDTSSIFFDTIAETIKDSYKRLIAPSLEREMRNTLTERAEIEAVKIFAKNTEKLLMVPPIKGARIISIDPGYRTGCKVAVLNQTGKLLAYTTIYPTKPKADIEGSKKVLRKLADKCKVNTIVIGNGTGSRETEEVVAQFIAESGLDIKYTIVNEAGASVYSASKIATEEYPDLDVTTRGAMSLGRRLQDPLAELVKIPTKSIGVGQYQHDINQKILENALDNVVEDCVNRVGVDLNTASPSLLSHIAGINLGIAKNVVAYREENGTFNSRTELKKVAKLGPKAFEQCAGFMRISGGKNPLDSTSVHPESYKVTKLMLAKLGLKEEAITNGGVNNIEELICEKYAPKEEKKPMKRAKGFDVLKEINKENESPTKNLKKATAALAKELEVGEMTLKDIIDEIKKPGRDPREGAPVVVFRNDIKKIEDLEIGMEMEGTVRNVVDFGAFVDIGIKNDGLVHISQMGKGYIKHPMDVVSVGDNVKVKILEVDTKKGKVALTMKLGEK